MLHFHSTHVRWHPSRRQNKNLTRCTGKLMRLKTKWCPYTYHQPFVCTVQSLFLQTLILQITYLFCETYMQEFFLLCSSCIWQWNENNSDDDYVRVGYCFVISAPLPLRMLIVGGAATTLTTPLLYGIVLVVFRILHYDTNI